MATTLEKTEDDLSLLTKKYNTAVEELFVKRHGYYVETIQLLSKEDKLNGKVGEPYICNVYVKELDRFTNGTSKIQLTDLELISGYDHSQYNWVKQCIREKFSSIKIATDVEWLESEEHIKELRREKLEKIKNLGSE